MLKMEAERSESGRAALRLEGSVVGPWVDELARWCSEALEGATSLVVDLAAVSFVDRRGVELLQALGDRGVVVRGSSPFVGEQLRGWAVVARRGGDA
jgi:anti-anti-sigma regulatory factor